MAGKQGGEVETVHNIYWFTENHAIPGCDADGCQDDAVCYLSTDTTSTLYFCRDHLVTTAA